MSQILKFYSGKSVLITGATGFMGKVLLAKILQCMPDINHIYVLIRSKKGLNPQERIENLLKSKPFSLIKIDERQFKKVVAISGNTSDKNLGLSNEDRATIIENVSVVFHFAAAVRFDLPLKEAVAQNVIGTEGIMDLCMEIKHLKLVVHLSTAYCNIGIDDVDEKVYDLPNVQSPRNTVKMIMSLNDEHVAQMEKQFISPNPNTYTYTKRLAELIVKESGEKLPVVIVRPSIVMPACNEPVPGWVDSLNGAVGISIALFKGVTQIRWIDKDVHPPHVPVDIAIDIAIVAGFVRCTETFDETPVFHATKPLLLSWYEVGVHLENIMKKLPLKKVFWYSNLYLTKSRLVYEIGNVFLHFLPAILVDFLLIMFLQRPFLFNVQKRIYEGSHIVSYFGLKEFNFKTENMDSLLSRMNDKDREIFNVFERHIGINYFDVIGVESRKYCINEEPSNDLRLVLKYYGYYLLDKIFKIWILHSLFKFILGFISF